MLPIYRDARRQLRRKSERMAIPWIVVGFGAFLIAAYFAALSKDGELLVFSFLGLVAWSIVILMVIERQVRKEFLARANGEE